ncbi:unnamed protein product [Echinostoma caproni]|uniref:U-box domain-containing protein n=1 Tax=Echinostoma caproni TaxID=27848 RepID=A0A3P8GJ98_9TREM|nr:unnamed protein product [Echinostoma caproni]
MIRSNAAEARECGMLCPPIVRPPVNVLFCLPIDVDLHAIVIKPYIGRHRVTGMKIFLLSDAPNDDNPTNAVVDRLLRDWKHFRPLASVNLESYPARTVVIVRLRSEAAIPAASCSHSAMCLYEINIPVYSNDTPSSERLSPTVTNGSSIVAPEQFVDFLTGELMQEPIRLPSGNYVDRSSLIQFWNERKASNARSAPVDPFTMMPLDETRLTCDVRLKATIEDYIRRWKRMDQLCTELDRDEPAIPLPHTLSTKDYGSEEDSSDEGNRILERYPHLTESHHQ